MKEILEEYGRTALSYFAGIMLLLVCLFLLQGPFCQTMASYIGRTF